MEALGVDIGSYKTLLAQFKHQGVEVVLSESSSKTIPTVVAYTDQERLFGDQAQN